MWNPFGSGGQSNSGTALFGMGQEMSDYYSTNILPMLQKQFQSVMSPETLKADLASSQKNIDTQYANSASQYKGILSGLGVTPTARQQGAFDKSSALSKGMAEAGTQNAIRQQTGIQRDQVAI